MESLYPIAKSLLFQLDAERAHHWTLAGMDVAGRMGILRALYPIPDSLQRGAKVMGLHFPNLVGLAAGMDKTGAHLDAFGELGFGHLEIGTVTPRPQPGNPKPRLFRLPEYEAIINRMGFNNPGADGLLENVRRRKTFKGILGINLGKNFDTPNEEATEDYVKGLRKVYQACDYVAVNLSSPNTKGLRDLQSIDSCRAILLRLQEERERLEVESGVRRPIAVKFAPDLSDDQMHGLAEMLSDIRIDAVIATNTTIDRASVSRHPLAGEAGGLSGAPLVTRSLECLQVWRRELDSAIPIISVGGILDGSTAGERLEAGAALVQLYTGLIYRGPDLVREVLEGAAAFLDAIPRRAYLRAE